MQNRMIMHVSGGGGATTSSTPPWDDEESSSVAVCVAVANQAFPLVKFGSYLIVLHCAAVALCTGVLALAPPRIVASMGAIPEWSKALVAAVAFVTLAWQLVGLIAVIVDNTILYRIYVGLNFCATVVLIIITLAFAITAAARQNESYDECMANFEQPLKDFEMSIEKVQDTINNGRRTACNIVTWVNIGVMFGLIALIGLMQLYLCFLQRVYGKRQRAAKDYAFRSEGYAYRPNAIPALDSQQPLMDQRHTGDQYQTYGPSAGYSYR